MVTILIIVLVMLGFALAYAHNATRSANGATQGDFRYQARLVAMSGLDRALAELDASVVNDSGAGSTGCGHGSPACNGNVDGNVKDCSLGVGHVSNQVAQPDTYTLDTGAATPDGWPDFQGQSPATPTVSILRTSPDGSYTARCQPVGVRAGNPGRFTAFKLRSYGVWKREVAGVECLARKDVVKPFQFACFGIVNVTGGGSFATDSWNSGWPTGAVPYSAALDTHNGNLASNGTVSVSGSYSVDGTIEPNANLPVPAVAIPPEAGAGPITVNAATTISADTVVKSINLSGAGATLTVNANPTGATPAPTLKVWIQNSVSVTGNGQIVVNPGTPPGIVKFLIEPSCTSVVIHGNSISNTGDPGNLQIISASTTTIDVSGGPNVGAAIIAPNATVQIGGNAEFRGGVTSSTVKINGNINFHYDDALSSLTLDETPPIYRIVSVVDIPSSSPQ
jgi:hypothetical protein